MDWPILKTGETHVWQAKLDGDANELRHLRALLSTEERERAAKFHFAQDQERFVRCRGMLRVILGRYLNFDPSTLRLGTEDKGKPRLEGAQDKVSLSFNLSHSDSLAVFAICLNRPIGIDVERLRSVPDAENMVESYFSENEKIFFGKSAHERRDEAFLGLWTKKEAYLKAIGEGLAHPLDKDPDLAAGWVIEPLQIQPGFVAAIATQDSLGKLYTFNWDAFQLLQ